MTLLYILLERQMKTEEFLFLPSSPDVFTSFLCSFPPFCARFFFSLFFLPTAEFVRTAFCGCFLMPSRLLHIGAESFLQSFLYIFLGATSCHLTNIITVVRVRNRASKPWVVSKNVSGLFLVSILNLEFFLKNVKSCMN